MTSKGSAGRIVQKVEQGPGGVPYAITRDDHSEYRIDERAGKLMVYNHMFGRWDPLDERFWDEE